jgi:hypothetical protein
MEKSIQNSPDVQNASANLVTLNGLIMQFAKGTLSPDAFNSAVDNWLVENKDNWQEKDLYDLFQLSITN